MTPIYLKLFLNKKKITTTAIENVTWFTITNLTFLFDNEFPITIIQPNCVKYYNLIKKTML